MTGLPDLPPGQSLADPSSRLGQLQRGRGAGYQRAVQNPAAARADVLHCILHDPRSDPQEARARYYAELAMLLDVPIAPIVAAALPDEPYFAAIDVLAEMAARGSAEAMRLLTGATGGVELRRHLVSYLRDYPAWAAANLPLAAVADLAGALHRSEDLVVDIAIYPEFWRPWAGRIPSVAAAFVEAAADAAAERDELPPPPPDPAVLPTAALLDLLEANASSEIQAELVQRTSAADRALLAWRVEHGSSARMFAAADALGLMGDPRLLELAESTFGQIDDPTDGRKMLDAVARSRRAALCRYVASLPPGHTLGLARLWWRRGGYFATVAARVLAQHAEPQDRLWLEQAVRGDLDAADLQRPVDALEALRRIGDPATQEVFAAVYDRSPSSYVRSRALAGLALQPSLPRAAERLAEALWDCEGDARDLALQHVPAATATPAAQRRLQELANDPLDGADGDDE